MAGTHTLVILCMKREREGEREKRREREGEEEREKGREREGEREEGH